MKICLGSDPKQDPERFETQVGFGTELFESKKRDSDLSFLKVKWDPDPHPKFVGKLDPNPLTCYSESTTLAAINNLDAVPASVVYPDRI
jgi:hypothetical protein